LFLWLSLWTQVCWVCAGTIKCYFLLKKIILHIQMSKINKYLNWKLWRGFNIVLKLKSFFPFLISTLYSVSINNIRVHSISKVLHFACLLFIYTGIYMHSLTMIPWKTKCKYRAMAWVGHSRPEVFWYAMR
jgi:hypothetical protein